MDLEPLKIDRSSRAAPARRRSGAGAALPFVFVALAAGALWLFWQPLRRTLDRVRLPRVRTVRAERASPAAAGAVAGLAANGYVVAARRAALSADTPGRIVELRVTEGTLVQEGELVARLFDEEYAAALRRAEADLVRASAAQQRARAGLSAAEAERARAVDTAAASSAAVAATRADLDLARRELARAEELAPVNPERDLDRARAALARAAAAQEQSEALELAARRATATAAAQVQVARADLEVAAAQVQVARAARDLAAATLKKTEVRAPFKGIVVLKDAEVGEVVSPNVQGGSNARGAVATLVDFSSLEVQADLPEPSLEGVAVGAPAQVFLDAYPGQPYPAKVSRIWPTANRQKATIEVRVRFDQLDDRLRPEMGVRVVFSKPGAAPAASQGDGQAKGPPPIMINQDALVRLRDAEGVFVLERGAVRFAPLRLGERQGGSVAVLEGLEEGARVVLAPPGDLGDGDRVLEEEPQ
ncbi:MAG: efflux RND transporter periplasmic adaptor subunit [Planctomycetota bacterium]